MIEVTGLSKRYGRTLAVDDLTFRVRPGVVTGFLGPNGAGKSTTLRVMLGLDSPSTGTATVNGRPYAEHASPLHEVGALLDARSVHPGLSARSHLLAMARTCGIPRRRVEDVIEAVGLGDVARRRVGRYSLGMGQRLGIATALLGDPATVVLDEPLNGLDTEGIRWVRALLRDLAAQGRTVFVSSHLMNEMAITAERVIVIGRGRLVADASVDDLVGAARSHVFVRTTGPTDLAGLLTSGTVRVQRADDGLVVTGATTDEVGRAAVHAGLTVLELTERRSSLEEAFLDLTRDAADHRGSADLARPQASVASGSRAEAVR